MMIRQVPKSGENQIEIMDDVRRQLQHLGKSEKVTSTEMALAMFFQLAMTDFGANIGNDAVVRCPCLHFPRLSAYRNYSCLFIIIG
jgi:hypothetical protein